MTDEKKLIEKLANKENNSINEAIDVYTPYLCTVLYNLAGNSLSKEDTEEILSDVFVTLWRSPGAIDLEKGTMRAYLAAVARNFALKMLNRKKEFVCLDDVELADGDFADGALTEEFLWNAVMSLGEPDNEIFVRYYKFGEKLKTIAKTTGLNVSTVKTKIRRGKQKLKKILSNAEERL